MTEKLPKDKAALYSNGDPEDRKAVELLIESGVPYINFGPDSEIQTPYIEYGCWHYVGLKDIANFIDRWNSGTLPVL